jgi:hypothetical protein
MKPVISVVRMWAIAIPTQSAVCFFLSYSPVLSPRMKSKASLKRYRIANMKVKTKNLCMKKTNNAIILSTIYIINIQKRYEKGKK